MVTKRCSSHMCVLRKRRTCRLWAALCKSCWKLLMPAALVPMVPRCVVTSFLRPSCLSFMSEMLSSSCALLLWYFSSS